MNKKLLFGVMSLAALAACTNDDFDSQQQVAEGTSPVQFEVLNNDASMRATLGKDDAVVFSAKDGDLFTLYHGGSITSGTPDVAAVTGYQNATYTTKEDTDGSAVLTTPSMILPGGAIMVWPADTTFSIKSDGNLSVSIPTEQPKEKIENRIPYVSDLIKIGKYVEYNKEEKNTYYNTAGKDRKYPVFMRTMASVLNLKADFAGTESILASLYTGDDPIKKIEATSIELLTGDETKFSKTLPVTFTAATDADKTRWNTYAPDNAWAFVTGVNRDGATATSNTLTTEYVDVDDKGRTFCKFIMLPQPAMDTDDGKGVQDAAIVVNTTYGRVYICKTAAYPSGYPTESRYNDEDLSNAWYRYISSSSTADEGETKVGTAEDSGEFATKHKTYSTPEFGLQQTINAFGKNKSAKPVVNGEYVGGAATRFVKVLLTKLNMDNLHIKNDDQLRGAARVWEKMGLADVTVYLDGDANHEFKMSQKTIKVINDINAKVSGKSFKVKPCTDATHTNCTDIVITGGGNLQDIAFIEPNGGTKVNVVLNADETWKWNVDPETKVASIKVQASAVTRFINKGTILNNANATLKTLEKNGAQSKVVLQNDNIWNIDGGILIVHFSVLNNGTVNIAKGAQYRQDGLNHNFVNNATDVPERFGGNDSKIGVVINKGVFATVNDAKIQNRGLIKHDDVDAKTYITTNETEGAVFKKSFGSSNKKGMIILPWANRFEDNVSVSAAATAPGFVAVETANSGVGALTDDAFTTGGTLSTYVNYIMINGDVTEIQGLNSQFKYVEIHQTGEVAWKTGSSSNYTGLMVLSDVNIKLGTTVNVTGDSNDGATYLGADMYVGGTFTTTTYNGYYGPTFDNVASKYITY